jgi:signal transduction histidine kinase
MTAKSSAIPISQDTSFNGPGSLIRGSGEMAERTRAFDWSQTCLGPIAQWPEVLLITVNTLLSSRQPMMLLWGDDLIQLYNDAHRPSIGPDKHPGALGQKCRDCWPEIWSAIKPQLDTVMQEAKAVWHEDQLLPVFRNGKLEDVYWTYSYSPVWDASGEVCGTLVVSMDTTERIRADITLRQAEAALRQSEERLLLAQSAGKIASWEWDLATGNFIWDQGSVWTYGRPPSQMTHVDQIFLYLHEDDRARVLQDLQPAIQGRGEYRSQFRVIWPDGSTHWIDASGTPILSSDGKAARIVGINMDVTERKMAEGALIQNEKLAAVGRLASSIAHEINNPLESVTNLVFLARACDNVPEAREFLATADAELRRASAITNQTLRFHKQSSRPTEVACDDLLGSVLTVYNSRLHNSRIHVEKRKRAHRSVLCFDGEIRQVLSNLVGNSIDAMQPGGGRLLIRSREGRDWKSGRAGLILTVADNGPGMSRKTAARAFDAFFTTKGIGGTGLGLWISKEIVDRHRGTLHIRSSQKQGQSGTAITVFLPFEAAVR